MKIQEHTQKDSLKGIVIGLLILVVMVLIGIADYLI